MPLPGLATLLIALTSICFGTVPLFARMLLDAGLSPQAVALYRFGLALPLALLLLPRRRGTLRPTMALAAAGLASGVGWTSYLNAIDKVPVASAGVIYMSYPLFVVLLARLLLGQRITARATLGATFVLTGAFIVNAPGMGPGTQWLPLLSSLSAPIGFALIVVMLSTAGPGLTTLERWSAIAVGHVVGLLPAALLAGTDRLLPGSVEAWAWVVGIALVTATVPQMLYTLAARNVTPARAAAAGATELPTMLAVGWLAFGEHIGAREGLGALLVLAAIAVTPAVGPQRPALSAALAGADRGRD